MRLDYSPTSPPAVGREWYRGWDTRLLVERGVGVGLGSDGVREWISSQL